MVLQPSLVKSAPALPRLHLHNHVVPVLFAVAVAAALTTGFLALAPNRLVSGHPIALAAAVDPRLTAATVVLGIALLATSLLPPVRSLQRGAAALAGGLVLL